MTNNIKSHKVTFLPENKIISVEHLKTIFETILENNPQNIQLNFACGAEGICQKCKIRAFQKMGPYTPTEKGCLNDEEIKKGIRLACQARVIQDTKAEIIYKIPFSISLMDEPLSADIDLNPRVKKVYFKTEKNGILTVEKFMDCINGIRSNNINHGMLLQDINKKLQKISEFFQKNISDCTAVFNDNEIICLEIGDTTGNNFAVAVDLGVNTLVLSLLNLNTGKKIAMVTDTNPQMNMAADLESRLNMASEDPYNMEVLNEEILLRVDILILELCRSLNISPLNVYEIIISGTTGMLHLFINGISGLNGQKKIFDEGKSVVFLAKEAEIRSSSRATIYTLPVISSYAGADITAGIIATQLQHSKETMLFIDLGSVSKAVIHHKGKIMATSINSGDAFECSGICFGMRPETGAIEGIEIGNDLEMSIIGGSLPRGICGSGIMESVAEFKRTGIINHEGDFQDSYSLKNISSKILERIINVDGRKVFLLYSDDGQFLTDIYVSQEDIYMLRKSKACILVMIKYLLKQMGININNISRVLIGGSFGHKVRTDVFFELGITPSFLKGNVSFVGNTSKKGAQMALLDKTILEKAETLVQNIICVPPVKFENNEIKLDFLPSF